MELGRWRDLKTAKVYVNLALLDLTEQTRLEGVQLKRTADYFHSMLARL